MEQAKQKQDDDNVVEVETAEMNPPEDDPTGIIFFNVSITSKCFLHK